MTAAITTANTIRTSFVRKPSGASGSIGVDADPALPMFTYVVSVDPKYPPGQLRRKKK